MKRMGGIFFFLLWIFAGWCGFFASSYAASNEVLNKGNVSLKNKGNGDKSLSDDTLKQLILLGKAYQMIKDNYVTPPSDQKLVEAAVNGMLHSLDNHSTFLNKAQFENIERATRGEFPGYGVIISFGKLGYALVDSVVPDSPADLAGLKAHDIITKINGVVLSEMSSEKVLNLFHSHEDTKLKMSVLRDGQIIKLTLVPGDVRLQAVIDHDLQASHIKYIRIKVFNKHTAQDVANVIQEAEKKDVWGYILDLRGNPGGLLDEAVSVAGDFLSKGEIVLTQGRTVDTAQAFVAKQKALTKKPVVVLIDGQTASAAEILTGALQDHKRAFIMGVRSFGKGSVQTIFPFDDGHEALKMTTQLYYTPSGKSIQGVGIEPDMDIDVKKEDSDKDYLVYRSMLTAEDNKEDVTWRDYMTFKAITYLKNLKTSGDGSPFIE